MFSFFKKKSSKNADSTEFLSAFANDLTSEEKGAILASFLAIATINFTDPIHKSETAFIDSISNMLGLPSSESSKLADDILKKGGEYAVKIIRNLSDGQKDWYTVNVISLIDLRGNPSEKRKSFAFGIIASIGIDGNRLTRILMLRDQLSK